MYVNWYYLYVFNYWNFTIDNLLNLIETNKLQSMTHQIYTHVTLDIKPDFKINPKV